MNVRVFVDTNILVYSRDTSEPEKQIIAMEWIAQLWQNRCGKISYQCLNEYYVTVTQRLKPGLAKETARADVKSLQTWNPTSVDKIVIESAWTIQDRYRFSWWDSLILSAAQKLDCQIILSEDMQHLQQVDNLQIINPFVSDISIIT
jgi:predicted nucleic acid-binding protein